MSIYKITEIYYTHSHFLIHVAGCVLTRVCKHGCDVLDLQIFFENYFIKKATEYFFIYANPQGLHNCLRLCKPVIYCLNTTGMSIFKVPKVKGQQPIGGMDIFCKNTLCTASVVTK